ncbi:hypothetical protein [uncultured Tateyamaria sp.]|uniref:hypothetical protein n=1 Tax=uncultured Tateyamaria sp. TaxID=455651 RepID=UPI00261C837E|nr:hypothetical protein [uncultured Tateyamaria sp.]
MAEQLAETSVIQSFLEGVSAYQSVATLVIAFAAVGTSLFISWYTKLWSVYLLRYEAVRNKRATAKALREEILVLGRTGAKDPNPIIFDGVRGELGRLNEESIEKVLQFYLRPTFHDQYKDYDNVLGEAAAQALAGFLEDTLPELRYLERRLGYKKTQ